MEIVYQKEDHGYGKETVIDRYWYIMKSGNDYIATKVKLYKSWWVEFHPETVSKHFFSFEEAIAWLNN